MGICSTHFAAWRSDHQHWLEEQVAMRYSTATIFFLRLIKTVQQALRTTGVEDSQVFTERFQVASSVFSLADNAETFEVLLHASDHSSLVEVPPGISILDAALSEHIPLRYSCKTGTCGLCVGKVLKGRVNMAFNGVLAPSETREGRVLLCQCYPADDAVTIEADAEWTIFFE